jgi:hypothetical protein
MGDDHPILPELVKRLRTYIKRYGTTSDGRIVFAARLAAG